MEKKEKKDREETIGGMRYPGKSRPSTPSAVMGMESPSA